jgi:predicted RNase H-like HicB family nuclease
MKYHFRLEHADDGTTASCIELEGCLTEGGTPEEVRANCKEALNLYLDEPPNSSMLFPPPQEGLEGPDIEAIEVDLAIAFAQTLRMYRVQNNLTRAEMAHRLDMALLFSYRRLERRSNPTLEVMTKIHDRLPDFSFDSIFS